MLDVLPHCHPPFLPVIPGNSVPDFGFLDCLILLDAPPPPPPFLATPGSFESESCFFLRFAIGCNNSFSLSRSLSLTVVQTWSTVPGVSE